MWNWFVAWGWLYCMIIMSVILTVQMIVHWKEWDGLTKLGAFTVIVLTFHVWEEWVIPGGFHYIYNIDSAAALRSRYPMSQITDMITNFCYALCKHFEFVYLHSVSGNHTRIDRKEDAIHD